MPEQHTPQPLDYASPEPRKRSWRNLVALLMAVFVTAILLFLAIPSLHRSTATAPQARCASNMHQIGLAILLYQNDHTQSYPNSLEELMEEQITTPVFICPGSNDTPSSGATTQQIGIDFHSTGHLSYIYLGKGLDDKTVTDDMVILYEPLANHANTGMNVLFGDGHAEWANLAVGQKIITAAATGKRVKVNILTGVVTTAAIASTQPILK